MLFYQMTYLSTSYLSLKGDRSHSTVVFYLTTPRCRPYRQNSVAFIKLKVGPRLIKSAFCATQTASSSAAAAAKNAND